jgi:hypothetical protein
MLQALLSSQPGLAKLHVIILIRALTCAFASRRRSFYTQWTRVRHAPSRLCNTMNEQPNFDQDLLPDQLQGDSGA